MEKLNETWDFKKLYGLDKKVRCSHSKLSKFFLLYLHTIKYCNVTKPSYIQLSKFYSNFVKCLKLWTLCNYKFVV